MEIFDDTIEIDDVLIENQPSKANNQIKIISVEIYTFFNMLKLIYKYTNSINIADYIIQIKKVQYVKIVDIHVLRIVVIDTINFLNMMHINITKRNWKMKKK